MFKYNKPLSVFVWYITIRYDIKNIVMYGNMKGWWAHKRVAIHNQVDVSWLLETLKTQEDKSMPI